MNHIAIVPARAGSKGVPNKNLRLVGTKSLVHRALQSAIDSKIFDEVILSTDIPVLLDEKNTDWVVHQRTPFLSQDSSSMPPVVLDVIDKRKLKNFQIIWLLQPSSPFRKIEDFIQIQDTLKRDDVKSVISVTPVGDSHPSRHYTLSKVGDLKPILGNHASFENRQNLKPVYERNGLYYVTSVADFNKSGSFYVPRCKSFEIERIRSFNINDELDLKLANEVVKWL